jgi:hypothetical protein
MFIREQRLCGLDSLALATLRLLCVRNDGQPVTLPD